MLVFTVQLSHAYMTTEKAQSFDSTHLCQQRGVLLFNMLSRLVIAFLPRSKYLLISWLQSPSTVILEPKKIKSVISSLFFPFYLPWGNGTVCHELSFQVLNFKPPFKSPLSPFSKGSLVPFHFLPLEWYHLHIRGCCISPGNLDSNLWFIQSGSLHDLLCTQVK